MKVTFIGHAAILIEARGLRILSDPWWQGPCFGNQWWLYPKPYLEGLNGKPIDYIFISHAHTDHFHRGTLRRFPRGTKVLVSDELELAGSLRDMHFEVMEVSREEVRELGGGVICHIIPTYAGDSLMIVNDHNEICVNANDSLHAAPKSVQDRVTAQIKALYPRIDYLYCAYGIASHFPNCYIIPGKDYVGTAQLRQRYFNRQWARIVKLLEPAFAFPFAADVIFLDPDLFWANEPVRNAERPTSAYISLYPTSATKVADIAPGFVIADGVIIQDKRFEAIRAAELRSTYADAIATYELRSERSTDGADMLKEILERNTNICRSFLLEYSKNYRFLVLLRDRTWALAIVKSGMEIRVDVIDDADSVQRADYDIVLTSNFAYLRRSLTHDYGNEVLFVGSGCLIEYTDRRRLTENLHEELTVLIAKCDSAPTSRFGEQPKWLFQIKYMLKRALGRIEVDLYDLRTWTLFKNQASSSNVPH